MHEFKYNNFSDKKNKKSKKMLIKFIKIVEETFLAISDQNFLVKNNNIQQFQLK